MIAELWKFEVKGQPSKQPMLKNTEAPKMTKGVDALQKWNQVYYLTNHVPVVVSTAENKK